jgi:hypothetical protein
MPRDVGYGLSDVVFLSTDAFFQINFGGLCGTARHGTARHGTARHGTARHGTARHDMAWHGTARHGKARHGMARHGTALSRTGMLCRALLVGTGVFRTCISLIATCQVPGCRFKASSQDSDRIRVQCRVLD